MLRHTVCWYLFLVLRLALDQSQQRTLDVGAVLRLHTQLRAAVLQLQQPRRHHVTTQTMRDDVAAVAAARYHWGVA